MDHWKALIITTWVTATSVVIMGVVLQVKMTIKGADGNDIEV